MCVQNWKFVALPFPEIIGGTQKIWAVPGYAQAHFSAKFLMGFCSDGPSEYTCQISDEHKHCTMQPFDTAFGGHRGILEWGPLPPGPS